MKQFFRLILQVSLPFILGFGILWWMYRGTDWSDFVDCVAHRMHWGWMALSLVFGIIPQVARALRWRMALEPLGYRPRSASCIDTIFVSYAASLVVPRAGEVTRCGTLKKAENVSFTLSIGTVVTERLVDSVLMLLLTGLSFLLQIPVFLTFLERTGMNLLGVLTRFTGTGYLVTLICLVAAVSAAIILLRRFAFFKKWRDMLQEIKTGIFSLRHIKGLPYYIFYSLMIWVGYYLHFYIAFFCFDFSAAISPVAALLIFCVGSFAVLVPTPNGAGPWHFAVKTMLVIYGVAESDAILFALVVHTIQTALVVVLGAYGWARLAVRPTNNSQIE